MTGGAGFCPSTVGSKYRCETCFFIVKAGSYPLGVWVNDWAAGHLVAEMMTILIEEKIDQREWVKVCYAILYVPFFFGASKHHLKAVTLMIIHWFL